MSTEVIVCGGSFIFSSFPYVIFRDIVSDTILDRVCNVVTLFSGEVWVVKYRISISVSNPELIPFLESNQCHR